MVIVIAMYLIGIATSSAALLVGISLDMFPAPLDKLAPVAAACATGALGGTLYCLRAIYINKAARKQWDPAWHCWYFLRPATSVIAGGASYVFLKAGLLILDASRETQGTDIGFYALAFIAGLNVDKFVAKVEGVAQAVWGIERSRSSKEDSNSNGNSTHS